MLLRTRTCLFSVIALASVGAIAACSSPNTGESVASSPADAVTVASAAAPAWAKTSNFAGRVDGDAPLSVQVHLNLRALEAAKAELESLSDPESASFGQYLSDEQFNAKYAPTDAEVAVVRAHLEANGLRVTELPTNRAYVTVQGSASQVERAFATRLGQYRVGTELRHAPMDAVKLPSAVHAHVSTVLGLATTRAMKSQRVSADAIEPAATARICTEYLGQTLDTTDPPYGAGYDSPLSYVQCGYKPAQLRALYGLTDLVRKGTDGTGQKVAIVDAYTSPTLVQDAQTYFANEDADYPLATSQITLLQGPGTASPVDTGWFGEQSLDVEAVHAIAPGAAIVYVGAQSAQDADLIAAVNLIVTGRLASVISNSYGQVESESYGSYTGWQSIAIQAGLKGIGLYFASGDGGDNAGDPNNTFGPSPLFPASLAEVTGVGGTSLAANAEGARVWELGWETGVSRLTTPSADAGADAGAPFWNPGPPGTWYFGAGGGVSQVYLQPSWQKGIVPTSLSTALASQNRVTPDVALLADPETGYVVGLTDPTTNAYSEQTIGGTSLATPLFTATVALAQQHAARKFGFANPLFYKASKKGAFTDIAPGSKPQAVNGGRGGTVITFDYHGAGNTLATATGFDSVTGLGVPNGAKFFAAVK